jgi:hypothetical protein
MLYVAVVWYSVCFGDDEGNSAKLVALRESAAKGLMSISKRVFLVGVIVYLISALVPGTKQAAIIYLAPKVAHSQLVTAAYDRVVDVVAPDTVVKGSVK